MAFALVVARSADIDADGPNLILFAAFSGPDVLGGAGDVADIPCRLLPSDQPSAIRTKITAAVQAVASARGYTVGSTDMSIPGYQRGA